MGHDGVIGLCGEIVKPSLVPVVIPFDFYSLSAMKWRRGPG